MSRRRPVSQAPPKIVGSVPQPGSDGTASSFQSVRPGVAQHIQFVGSLTNGVDSTAYSFMVLAGDGAPTVTDGFAKWNVIDRPQRVGFTVLTGYNPIVMDVPIMFDAVAKLNNTIEQDIQKLEWMGGRGTLFAVDRGVGHPGQGDSPLVRVFTTDSQGFQNPLVPDAYQTENMFWVVTGIVYDQSPLRDFDGRRIRQKVNVILTEHVGAPGSTYDSAATRARGKKQLKDQFKLFPVTKAHNTIRKIAVFDCHNPTHQGAVAILEANRSNPRLRLGRSIDADLTLSVPIGTRIKVPMNVIKPL